MAEGNLIGRKLEIRLGPYGRVLHRTSIWEGVPGLYVSTVVEKTFQRSLWVAPVVFMSTYSSVFLLYTASMYSTCFSFAFLNSCLFVICYQLSVESTRFVSS